MYNNQPMKKYFLSVVSWLCFALLLVSSSESVSQHHDQIAAFGYSTNGKTDYNSPNADITLNPNNSTEMPSLNLTGVPTLYNANGIAVNPITNKIYVIDYSNDSLYIANGRTDSVTGNLKLSSEPWIDSPNSIAVDPNTNAVYITKELLGLVSVYDGATNMREAEYHVGSQPPSDCIGPRCHVYTWSIAVDPIAGKIYTTQGCGCNSNSITVLTLNNGTEKREDIISGNVNPFGIAVNPSTHMVYVSNEGILHDGNTVSVINGSSNKIVDTVLLGTTGNDRVGPQAIAVNPETNMVYVATYWTHSLYAALLT